MRVIELFAGIGSQTQALKNLGTDHEVIAISEIDKHAIKSYEAIHGPVNNLGDISKITTLPDADLWTYSFPCQDISNAGKGAGFRKTSGTRSGLLWEVERLLNDSALPKYLLMENVPMLLSKSHKKDFDRWIGTLAQLGYTSYHRILNSKDFGVPQDRERVFMVSTLDNSVFTFPKGEPTTVRLADILEDEVSEDYYISPEKTNGLLQHLKEKTISRTIHTGGHDTATNKHKWDWVAVPKLNHNGVYHPNGLSPTVCAFSGGNTEPKIAVREATKKGYAIAEPGDMVDIGYPNSELRRGRVGKGIAHGLTTSPSQTVVDHDIRIRKLTPRECWRLMGFSDVAFDKAQSAGVSKTQLYRQAGNSIVVPVLEAIFAEMLKPSKAVQMTWRSFA